MNKKTYIKLKTINDIKEFVAIATACNFDVDLAAGRYVVDAKSIMGIFSLDLSKNIELTAHTENADEAEKFFEKIKHYIVK